jgi:hypothetical protein
VDVRASCGCVVPAGGKTAALEESPESASDCAMANGGRTVTPAIASNARA